MAAVNVTELRNGAVFQEGKDLLQVITYEHVKMGRGSGTVKVKVRNLKTGSVVERSFITGARVEGANIEKRKAQFLYQEGDQFNFMDPESFEQFSIPAGILADTSKYLVDGLEVTLNLFEEEAIGVDIPNTLIYDITDTGPEEKGNTVSNVYKEATLNNGLVVKVPMFMKVGDKVKVDTRTGLYVERVR